MPKISFIMPAYKSAFLRQAIDSIVGQSCDDWELVIVDDCSPEDLRAIVSEYNDRRIRYVRNEENIGGTNLVAQWNRSAALAAGKWLVLAGDDDMYAPDFCANVLGLAERYPQVNLIRSRVEQVDVNGEHLWDDCVVPEYMDRDSYFVSWMDARIFDCIGCFAFRKSALDENGGFIDFPCAFGSDIATPVALSCNGVALTSEMLFRFRQSDIHLSSDRSKDIEKLKAITQMYKWFGSQPSLSKYQSRLHSKCMYDYFNLVIRYSSLRNLSRRLGMCVEADRKEKAMMVLRWVKCKFFN